MADNKLTSKMRKLVAEYHKSGQSQKLFASSHDLRESKLSYWIRKFAKTEPVSKASISDFVPLSVTTSTTTEKYLVIRCSSGVEIEIPL